MTMTAPPWLLNREQSGRLQTYLQTYRRYAFVSLAPSVERNTTLRMLQAMQGKLITLLDQNTAHGVLHLTMQERTTLKTIIAELLRISAQKPATAERNATLTDLAALKTTLASH